MNFNKKVIDKKIVYEYNFSNLSDLYNYLKNNPKVNKDVFLKQISIHGDESSCGVSLDKAIEYINGGYNINFENFKIASNSTNQLGQLDDSAISFKRTIHGGTYLAPLVSANVAECMIKYEREMAPKCVTIYMQLGFPMAVNDEQIFNRGIATINLIRALEDKGYLVDLKAFSLTRVENEIIYINVNLKTIDEVLNLSKCYYPFVSIEFFRRLFFRVFESTFVENTKWGMFYGQTLIDEEIRKFLNLEQKEILINHPSKLGIKGSDVYQDVIDFFKNLKLDEEFDLTNIKQKVRKR